MGAIHIPLSITLTFSADVETHSSRPATSTGISIWAVETHARTHSSVNSFKFQCRRGDTFVKAGELDWHLDSGRGDTSRTHSSVNSFKFQCCRGDTFVNA